MMAGLKSEKNQKAYSQSKIRGEVKGKKKLPKQHPQNTPPHIGASTVSSNDGPPPPLLMQLDSKERPLPLAHSVNTEKKEKKGSIFPTHLPSYLTLPLPHQKGVHPSNYVKNIKKKRKL